jgi:N-acetylgalactosamine kinase
MLLGARGALVHLSFRAPVGIRGVRHTRFPDGYELIIANSQVRAEKSAEERRHFNRGIFAYRFAYLALTEAMAALGIAAGGEHTESLGDLHDGRIAPAELCRLILTLPREAGMEDLSRRYPERFRAAALSCFGTADLASLPETVPLRGAAVYGLGRVDRGRVMPELLEQGDAAAMGEFGRLMTITHDGDRNHFRGMPFREHQGRLEDATFARSDGALPSGWGLRHEPGFYGASIPQLDAMVDALQSCPGVLGSGLMGAGGGGCILILAESGSLGAVRDRLDRAYYRPACLEPAVEVWNSTGPACRLM